MDLTAKIIRLLETIDKEEDTSSGAAEYLQYLERKNGKTYN